MKLVRTSAIHIPVLINQSAIPELLLDMSVD